MDSKTKVINFEELKNLENIIKSFYELTKDKIEDLKIFNSCFSSFIDSKKCENKKDIIVRTNSEKIGKMLKNPYDRNKIKTCLEYSPTDIKTNFNILSISYGELSKIVDLGPADNFDDILRILEKCYELKDSAISSIIVRNLANNFIVSIANILTKKKVNFMNSMREVEFMEKNFKKILNSISKNKVISISDEKIFYDLLSKHYFAIETNEKSEEGKSCDLSQIIRGDIEDYNNSILQSTNPINKETNRFFKYLIDNAICELDYKLFTSLDNKYFLQIIKKVREKLNSENITDDIVEKLAILDLYMATYFKKYTDDTMISCKVKN